MNSYLGYSKNLLRKTNRPVSLVYFITHRCNLRCRHCFFLDELNTPTTELSLTEIDAFSRSIGKFLSLSLTGGEPFVREDIAEIARLFHANCELRNLNIPTNGLLTEVVVENVRKVLDQCPGLALNLAISLDGPRDVHDEIRKRLGAFDRSVETYRAAYELKRRYGNLSLEIITTLSAFNQSRLDEFYDFVLEQLRPDFLNLSPIRGAVKDAALKDVDIDRYDTLIGRLQAAVMRQEVPGYVNFNLSEYVAATRFVIPEIVSRTLRENAYQTPCYAGGLTGVVYADGDVHPCELLGESLGNLRDVDWDFMKLWAGERADAVRARIRETKCFCIHPCSHTVNVLFNVRYVPRLVTGGLRLRLARVRKAAG